MHAAEASAVSGQGLLEATGSCWAGEVPQNDLVVGAGGSQGPSTECERLWMQAADAAGQGIGPPCSSEWSDLSKDQRSCLLERRLVS